MFAYFRAPVSWTTLAKRTVAEIIDDDCAGLAAQLAFYFLLSVFPALLFLTLPAHDDGPQGPQRRKRIGPAAEAARAQPESASR